MGGAYGQAQQSSTGNQQNTYNLPGQSGLQGALADYFTSLVPSLTSGTLSPDVQAMKTASADQINQNAASSTDRTNSFLASRGFGQSGLVGQNALQTELGRQGDLAANESSYAGLQLNQNTQSLLAALNFATNPTGYTQAQNTNGSQWGVAAGVSV